MSISRLTADRTSVFQHHLARARGTIRVPTTAGGKTVGTWWTRFADIYICEVFILLPGFTETRTVLPTDNPLSHSYMPCTYQARCMHAPLSPFPSKPFLYLTSINNGGGIRSPSSPVDSARQSTRCTRVSRGPGTTKVGCKKKRDFVENKASRRGSHGDAGGVSCGHLEGELSQLGRGGDVGEGRKGAKPSRFPMPRPLFDSKPAFLLTMAEDATAGP